MSVLSGKVLSVETRDLAEPTTAAAAIGATSLPVADCTTFDENGGILDVNGTILFYSGIDESTESVVLVDPLAVAVDEGSKVELYPPMPIRTALVALEDSGDTIPATVPQSLLDKFVDGIRNATEGESVTLERRGNYEYLIADVVAEPLVQTSLDFSEAEQGIMLSEQGAQFADVNVLQQLGASAVSADTITLAGKDLATQMAETSIGKLISARLPAQAADLAIPTNITKLFELNCGTVPGGRTYRATVTCMIRNTAAVANTDRLQFTFRYTADGSTPTVTSPFMDGGYHDNSICPAGNWVFYQFSSEVDIVTTSPLKIGFNGDIVTGAGSYTMYALASASSRPVFALYDDGPLGARQDSALTLTGGGTSRFVKTFNATWSYGAEASTGAELVNSWGSIGGADDMFAYVGFDSAAMVSALSGAISPVSLVVRWRARTKAASSGLDVRLGTHNLTSAAAAAGANSGWPAFGHANLGPAGITLLSNIRNNAAINTPLDDSIGATVFNQFKAGTRKGIAFFGEPEFAAGGEGSVYLDGTNQVQLIFTYDGTS